jgi:lycopene cyclase CruA
LGSYLVFTLTAIVNLLFSSWVPALTNQIQPWLESKSPRTWLKLLAFSYSLQAGTQSAPPPPSTSISTESLKLEG